jgi:hypothetical protein
MRKIMTNKESRDLFEQAKSYAYDYMDNAYERAVFPTEDIDRSVAAFVKAREKARSNG